MEQSELVVCTVSKVGEDDSEILKTSSRLETDIWSYCNASPQLRALESTEASTSTNVTKRKRMKRTSDYSVRSHDQSSTLNTPLKIHHADEEIEHLVNCVKVCSQNNPELKILTKDSVAATSTNKKRRYLSKPVQLFNASNFDPLDLFSEPPPDSVKKKRRQSSLRLPRRPMKGRNGISGILPPISKLRSPLRRKSRVPILRLLPRSPVLDKKKAVNIASDLPLQLAKSRMKTSSTGPTVSCDNFAEELPTSFVMSKRMAAGDLQVSFPKFVENKSKILCDIPESSWGKSTNELHCFPISSNDMSTETQPLNAARNNEAMEGSSGDTRPVNSVNDSFEDPHSNESLDDAYSRVAEMCVDQPSLDCLRLDIVRCDDIGDLTVVGSSPLKNTEEIAIISSDMNCDCVAIVRSSAMESSSVIELSQPKTSNKSSVVEISQPKTPNKSSVVETSHPKTPVIEFFQPKTPNETNIVLWEVNCDSGFAESTPEPLSETTVLRQENEEQSKFHSQENFESEFRNPCSNEYTATAGVSHLPDAFKTVEFPAQSVEKDCANTLGCPTAENTRVERNNGVKLLPLDCVMFATKSLLWLDGIFEREIIESRTVASSPSSPEMLENNVVQFEASYTISSPPLTNGHAGKNEADLSEKEISTVRRSGRTKTKIRKSVPKLEVRHTPMGLPKPIRANKEKFSVEEIYLNKNFRTPTEKKWETIFEFPTENKDGSISTHEKRKKRRRCDFMTDPSQRRVRWKKNKVKLKRKFKSPDGDVDKILSQKLVNLDNALQLADLSP